MRCEMGAAWEAGLQDQLGLIVPQIVSILWVSTRWSGLWSGFIIAPHTSTSLRCEIEMVWEAPLQDQFAY
jgi:hypothetical protein